MNAQEVLRSIVEQIKDKEGLQGLIILDARYGQLTSTINENSIKIIDVTVPLQALVKDSTLKIGTTVSKSNLTGFYDPCIGEEKNLFIKYSFRSQIHTVLYKDTDPVILPNRGNEIYLFLSVELIVFSFNYYRSFSIMIIFILRNNHQHHMLLINVMVFYLMIILLLLNQQIFVQQQHMMLIKFEIYIKH
jgi:hypothetical protein